MVIEHSFVTTLPSREALTAASEMLSRAGFVAETQGAFRIGETDWTSLQMKRGRSSITRAKDPTECPQRIRLDWDRGRITIAASIEPRSSRRSFYYGGVGGMVVASDSRVGRATRDYSDLMILITTSLEALLVQRITPESASQSWYAFQEELKEKARKSRRRGLIVVGVLFSLVILIIVLTISASLNHW